MFNTVEGNTTFYRVPDADSVSRWREALAGRDFEFCFKLPREVTHEHRPDLDVLETFLRAIAPLRKHVGPLLVQFPATVDAAALARYEAVLDAVAAHHRFVLEVRHDDFFGPDDPLAAWLDRYEAGRVAFDSRPLFRGDLSHPEVQRARHEKPDVPVVDTVHHGVTLVRLILHPDLPSNAPYLTDWARRISARLRDGVRTYMMIHCPNNLHCPPLAARFHNALNAELAGALPALAPWPVPSQQSLLDF